MKHSHPTRTSTPAPPAPQPNQIHNRVCCRYDGWCRLLNCCLEASKSLQFGDMVARTAISASQLVPCYVLPLGGAGGGSCKAGVGRRDFSFQLPQASFWQSLLCQSLAFFNTPVASLFLISLPYNLQNPPALKTTTSGFFKQSWLSM